MQRGVGIERVAEADLPRTERTLVASAILVMHRQQRQPDAGNGAGRGNPLRHFGRIGIRRAARLVMQVMKFDIGRVARFEHLHLHETGDCLDMLGRQPVEKAEHQLPPGPERIRGIGAAPFGEARHGALEGVRMAIGRRRKQDPGPVTLRRLIGFDRNYFPAGIDADPDMVRPATLQQCLFGPNNRHGPCLLTD